MTTAADSIDEAMHKASEVLAFASADWRAQTGRAFPQSRSIDELRAEPVFGEESSGAVVAATPFRAKAEAAE